MAVTNYALSATVETNSGVLDESNLNDGNTGTQGTFYSAGAFIVFDLGSAVSVDAVAVDAPNTSAQMTFEGGNTTAGDDVGVMGTATCSGSRNGSSAAYSTPVRYIKISSDGGTGVNEIYIESPEIEVPPVEPPAPTLTPQDLKSAQGDAIAYDASWTALYFTYQQKPYLNNASYQAAAPRILIPDSEDWDIRNLKTNVIYHGQFVAVGTDGSELYGEKTDFHAAFDNHCRISISTSLTSNDTLVQGAKIIIQGAGTAEGYSDERPGTEDYPSGFFSTDRTSAWGGQFALPEPDGDYRVTLAYLDGDDNERYGGQFTFNPVSIAATEGATFDPLYTLADSGVEDSGEKVFFDLSYKLRGIVDGVLVRWQYAPESPKWAT